DVPKSDRPIGAGASQSQTVRAEAEGADAAVPGKALQFLALGDVPEAHHVVFAAAGQELSIRAESDAPGSAFVGAQDGTLASFGIARQLDLPVRSRAGREWAVRAVADARDRFPLRVPPAPLDIAVSSFAAQHDPSGFQSRTRIPDARGAIPARGSKSAS